MPRTGFSHPKCYLRAAQDCSTTITREHFLSQAVIARAGGGLVLQFGPRSKGAFDVLPVRSLGANVLCKRHNELFAPADSEAAKLHRAFGDLNTALSGDGPLQEQKLRLSGDLLERWMLKALYGAYAAGDLRSSAEVTRRNRIPPADLLPVLLGEQQLKPPLGFYFVVIQGAVEFSQGTAMEGIRTSPTGPPGGCLFRFNGMPMLLALRPPEELAWQRWESSTLAYRPPTMNLGRGDQRVELAFEWTTGAGSKSIRGESRGRETGQPQAVREALMFASRMANGPRSAGS
jgi:hypothetical protein